MVVVTEDITVKVMDEVSVDEYFIVLYTRNGIT